MDSMHLVTMDDEIIGGYGNKDSAEDVATTLRIMFPDRIPDIQVFPLQLDKLPASVQRFRSGKRSWHVLLSCSAGDGNVEQISRGISMEEEALVCYYVIPGSTPRLSVECWALTADLAAVEARSWWKKIAALRLEEPGTYVFNDSSESYACIPYTFVPSETIPRRIVELWSSL